ncbi:YvcK family protein [Patescibacteria group bacterium]|nr:YvcK family protein [Patescibacteria group bacterium]
MKYRQRQASLQKGVKAKKIVVIGGGTGVYMVLSALRNDPYDLTAIVTMADDGGSTGVLREEFGILPPGDIRRALIALSDPDQAMLADLFAYRFSEGVGLTGHNFGNLFLTALQRLTGDFESAIAAAGSILGMRGNVIPVTLRASTLMAELEDGRVIRGETRIDVPQHDGRLRVKRVWLDKAATINPRAREAILSADLIIIGPGDLYTSLVPNLLVRGVPEALHRTKGKVAYLVNVMTKFGETSGFSASDFVGAIQRYLRPNTLDLAVMNNKRPSPGRLRGYVREHAEFVVPDTDAIRSGKYGPVPIALDLIRTRGYVRHDPQKVRDVVKMII